MYVDKKLGGVNAVQTLSRLNRSHPLKKDTFVLDFVNVLMKLRRHLSPILKVLFREATNPDKLFDLQDALDNAQVYTREQVYDFSDKILANVSLEQLHGILNEVANNFKNDLNEEEKEAFRPKVKTM
jgi:type I restriction enzyme R subunit